MPTERQLALAARLGVEIGDEPPLIAETILTEAFYTLLTGHARRPASEKQIAYGRTLGLELVGASHEIAHARISWTVTAKSNSAVAAEVLKPGDKVTCESTAVLPNGARAATFTTEEISSIGSDGMVYFKNPSKGRTCAWAVYVKRVAVEDPQREATSCSAPSVPT
jgi:hypothetical protein